MPPFFVVNVVAPLPFMPTAVHIDPSKQDTPDNEVRSGWLSTLHVPLLSPTIEGLSFTMPTATQKIALGQDTPLKKPVSAGGVCEFQVLPSVVSSMPSPPTAVHSSMVKHEIDWAGNVGS